MKSIFVFSLQSSFLCTQVHILYENSSHFFTPLIIDCVMSQTKCIMFPLIYFFHLSLMYDLTVATFSLITNYLNPFSLIYLPDPIASLSFSRILFFSDPLQSFCSDLEHFYRMHVAFSLIKHSKE